ncbi:MutT NTP pyrophosphohydrolases including oxidative damage repair enzymes [uncultured Caudovirales phage]|uniref:MutT NTP pyrophosphohydrolases including oxidative damage repair enzymes n=1 Tax=uncultured Caudovirales phage TaxID=2100421 RepID=A0A6J5L7H7_9CAUD|nr:MutT NTP pyrophosphohydrolases including oxidative damage repair enzymes [uncultured Caudovirales phage]
MDAGNLSTLTSIGALIYSKSTGRYLFLLRDKTTYSNCWGLCGGKLESGESLHHGLVREIREEIGGCDISRIVPLEQFTSENSRFIFHTVIAIVEREFTPTLNSEHKGYCWVPLSDHPTPLHPGVWRTFNSNAIIEKIRTVESTDFSS